MSKNIIFVNYYLNSAVHFSNGVEQSTVAVITG